jgi:hypothetical protein
LLYISFFRRKEMCKSFKSSSFLSIVLFTFSSLAQASIATINFDIDGTGSAINAPDLFSSATPLTNLYSASGVNFTALDRIQVTSQIPHNGVLTTITRNELTPSASGMGAILNDSSGFRRPAKSGDNFLAFNGDTAFGSHFWRISFDSPIGYFDIDRLRGANPDNNYYTHLDAYDVEGNLVGSRNNLYTGYDRWSSENYSGYRTSFKSETEISYVDIGHALNSGNNANSSFRPTPWSIVYDDLVFGDFADASSGTRFLSGGGGSFIPLPGSIWFLLTGLLGFGGLARKRKLTDE